MAKIRTTGNGDVDTATAEIAVALGDADPGKSDQHYYDEAMRLRDQIMQGTRVLDHMAELAKADQGVFPESVTITRLCTVQGCEHNRHPELAPGAYESVTITRLDSPPSTCPDCGQPYPDNPDCLTCTERHF